MAMSPRQKATNAAKSGDTAEPRRLRSVLIIDDDLHCRQALASAVAAHSEHIQCVDSLREAEYALQRGTPELVLLDFALGDGDAFKLLDLWASLTPQPVVIVVSGQAGVEQSFKLAQRGVRSYLQKPFTAAELDAAIERSFTSFVDFRTYVRAAVGHRAIHDIETEVRCTMLSEALARSGGNRRGAARLLAVSRQLLQHMLRALPQPADRGARDGASR